MKHFEAVQDLAAAKGVRYMPLDQVVQLPIDTLLDRIETIANRDNRPDPVEAAAVLRAKQPPALTVTRALEPYWTLVKDKSFGKSEDQKRRWGNPRKRAVRNLVSVVGDKPMNHITVDEMLEFRGYWQERIEIGGLTANCANNDLIRLGDILKTVNSLKWQGFALPLYGLTFKEGEKSERPPFSGEWIRTKLLALNALRHNVRLEHIQPNSHAFFACAAVQRDKPQQNAYIERYIRTVRPSHRCCVSTAGQWDEGLGQYIFETIEEAQDQATEWLWTSSKERPDMGIGGKTRGLPVRGGNDPLDRFCFALTPP